MWVQIRPHFGRPVPPPCMIDRRHCFVQPRFGICHHYTFSLFLTMLANPQKQEDEANR